MSKTRVEPAI